jgi:membrane fusion protein
MIADVFVADGQSVVKGQPLLALSSDPIIADGQSLSATLNTTSLAQFQALSRQAVARQNLIARQRDELRSRRQALVDQDARLRTDLIVQQQRIDLARTSAEAVRTLWQKELASAIQYRQREDAFLAATQSLSAIERELAAIKPSLAQLTAQDQRLIAEAEEAAANIAATEAQLQERRASNGAETRFVLTAQEDGQIGALQAKAGNVAAAGSTLAIILPKGVKLEAQFWVPSRAFGFVRPGDHVHLMYDAFPYQRFGTSKGKVTYIAGAPTMPSEIPAALQTEEALYKLKVDLDQQSVSGYGRDWRLYSGMRVTADLILERQSLMAWLFDKVNASRRRAEAI